MSLKLASLNRRLIRLLKRLFTDTDMHEQALKEEMEEFYSYLRNIVRVDDLTIPSENYDLVLDLMLNEDNNMQWSYYYACHDTRCLFWLERYDTTYVTYEVDDVESLAHFSASRVSVIAHCFHQSREQSISWRIIIGAWAIFYYIGSLPLMLS